MVNWLRITLLIASAGILVLVFLLILRRCFFHPKTRTNSVVSDSQSSHNFHNRISRLHQISSKKTNNNNNNYYVFREGSSEESPVFFSWADHPSLVADAVENGWSRFAFRNLTPSSPSVKSARSILGPCGANGDYGDEIGNAVEIGWEVCEGSEDYMQKIRLNPGLIKKMITTVDSQMGPVSVIRTGLPLPGPRFGNSCFPQEAYFEITILAGGIDDHLEKGRLEGEKIKLSWENKNNKIEEVEIGGNQDDGKTEIIWFSVGLAGKGPLLLKIPGSFPGSIGFNSDGSVYLNGTKLVFESRKDEWPQRTEKVIGCGYNPGQKKVYFTVDSQLVHEIHCKTEEFGYPLYPTLAANTDITVLFNLGQNPFKFAPAGNLQRTPNPCYISPGHASSPALGCNIEDSKELFSMGRIDSQWLQRSVTRNYNTVSSVRSLQEFDYESEADLFEIVLDSTGRSPYTRPC